MQVKLWDTAGQDRFRHLTYQFYRQADGIIICFDLTRSESFKNCRTWVQSIYKILKKQDTPKILVGNKVDLVDDRKVDKEAAEQFAEEYGIHYFETSALEGTGVNNAMKDIMK